MAPLPTSPSSSGTASASPRLLLHSNSSEWNVVVQRNIKSSLLLLLVLSTVFVFSVLLYSSHGFGAAATGEAITQSPLMTDLDVSRSVRGEEQADEPIVSAENNVTAEQSSAADISLPSATSSPAPAVSTTSTAEQTGSVGIQDEEKCDMSMGKWVREQKGPVYTNLTCPTLPDFKNCQKYGKDPGHLFWRWQPDGCDLPRFVPERFLDVVRGKRLAFIGDSLARNQMDSLLCLLSQAETPTHVYADAFDKFRTWHFPAHNFTLMVMWTEFYAHAVPVLDADGKPTASFDIHLDRLNTNWTSRLPGLDYAVISGGNWFFRVNYLWEDGRRVGCVNCREANLTDFGIAYAVRRVIRAALEAISQCQDCKSSLVTFLRTYTPDHFEHGSWFSGGYCNRTQPLEDDEISLESIGWELRRVQSEEVRRAGETTGSKRFGVLDVTKAMMLRADGHPGGHYDKRWVRNASDCLHWCLPGPVDMWNDVLLQRLAEISTAPVAR
ncbi:xyloglucan O-acetyltransferase 3-like isoform X2 [Phragmites australis]|uniref:xyloglucan O-acetyltransferase 3-like isoform X2 n=1 Tax=Phragmites australis TaxID=29695 RepID=UPI002D77E0EA|nr:xyloglucan O-acetyltransferase 3-like isoform X2 [Phragmites australis]